MILTHLVDFFFGGASEGAVVAGGYKKRLKLRHAKPERMLRVRFLESDLSAQAGEPARPFRVPEDKRHWPPPVEIQPLSSLDTRALETRRDPLFFPIPKRRLRADLKKEDIEDIISIAQIIDIY